MADLKTLETQIFNFLESDDSEVMAIKGDWGVGKTHVWKETIKKHKNKIQKDFKDYSYVSLFGIESIDKLKLAIFEKMVSKESIGEKTGALKLRNNLSKINDFFKENPIESIADIAGIGKAGKIVDNVIASIIGQAISNFSVENAIICLDDLERTNLDAQELLGLISELKEEKNCKVVLIFNEDQLPEKNERGFTREQYEKYHEKVIDVEMEFSPKPKECTEICFNKNRKIPDAAILKERCEKLEITNIRIMNKIIRLWKKIEPIVKKLKIKEEVISSLVLLTYSIRNKNDESPHIEFIKSYNHSRYNSMPAPDSNGKYPKKHKDNEEKEKHDNWSKILSSYARPFKLIYLENYFDSLDDKKRGL